MDIGRELEDIAGQAANRISDLEEQLKEKEDDCSNLEDRVEELKDRIGELEEELEELKGEKPVGVHTWQENGETQYEAY